MMCAESMEGYAYTKPNQKEIKRNNHQPGMPVIFKDSPNGDQMSENLENEILV